ncbi:MAG: UvrB/UvrC motif-containing protein [Clostridiales bacterium]|nr:UvrB/UvrC motif-containing protein [Clostridiales bacterium]
MLCQNCNKREATTHVKKIINAEESELHLCSECAAKLGYGNLFHNFGFSLGDIFGSFLNNSSALLGDELRCEKCGSSFNDIAHSGKVGCANCYKTFYDRLLPSLQRIHGKTFHSGKMGSLASAEAIKENKVEDLKSQLDAAVKEQNFELAATLRDEIKDIEKESENNA